MNFQKEEQRRRPRARSIIREFALNTSTHALPGIARSQSIKNKIFWSVSFIIFAGIMIYFVAQSIISYFQYPTQTSVSISVLRSQEFPAVTICNYGASRYDRTVVDYLTYTNSRNLTNVVVAVNGTYDDSAFKYIDDFFVSKINSGGSLEKYIFQLEDMLISCTYNGEPCVAGDFIIFESATYGNCYTFNAKSSNSSESTVRLTNQNGGKGKLLLKLYAHSHNYVPLQTTDVSVGMVAMIHDNTELPLIEDAGMYLSPGKRHKLAFNKKKNHLLSSPYSECTTAIPLAMQTMFSRYKGADYAYSQGVCNILCTQSYLFQTCGCVDPNHWSARSVVLPNSEEVIEATLCDPSNLCFKNATGRLSNSDSLWSEYCSDCKPACSTVEFVVSSSAAKTITTSYLMSTKRFVEQASIPLPANWTSIWSEEIPENYIAVDFVSQSNSVENYTEEASMSPVDVLSNVGGHTGLWIGISFLSIMELVEMIFRLVRHQLYRFLNRVRPEINHIA